LKRAGTDHAVVAGIAGPASDHDLENLAFGGISGAAA
jgi:hypothetical protein